MTKSNTFVISLSVVLTALVVATSFVLFTPAAVVCPVLEVPEPVVVTEFVDVEVPVAVDYKQLVVSALLEEASSDKDYRKCDRHGYDMDEITLKKVYEGFTLVEDGDDDLTISDVSIKLNYDEGDCYKKFVCSLDADNDLECV